MWSQHPPKQRPPCWLEIQTARHPPAPPRQTPATAAGLRKGAGWGHSQGLVKKARSFLGKHRRQQRACGQEGRVVLQRGGCSRTERGMASCGMTRITATAECSNAQHSKARQSIAHCSTVQHSTAWHGIAQLNTHLCCPWSLPGPSLLLPPPACPAAAPRRTGLPTAGTLLPVKGKMGKTAERVDQQTGPSDSRHSAACKTKDGQNSREG